MVPPVSAAQKVLERTLVTRLRFSRVATRIHDRLGAIRNPERFEALLQSPGPVHGLDLTLPYVDAVQTPADVAVWSMIAETALTGPLNASAAKRLRKAAFPLRLRASLFLDAHDLGGDPPYIEVHVHPFGAVGLATAALTWEEPEPLADAWSKVADVQQRSASVTIGEDTTSTTLGAAAGEAASRVVALLGDAGGEEHHVPDYRVATVIDGTVDPVPAAMPADASPLHMALHYLCGAGEPPAPPAGAFVPTWSGGGFRYWPRQLAYMVDRGAALWRVPAPHGDSGPTMGQQHRRLTLVLAHLTASVGLIDASTSSSSAGMQSWAKVAAQRLARLYGPASAEHGLAPQRYLDQTGFRALVETVLGKQLVTNDKYPLPAYD
jgi:hypothetical protein